VTGVLDDTERLRTMAVSARALTKPDAARQIADQVLGAIG
jgi:UDP-N-acetylglucosamine:LPS N-acetylglucosamine transferase